MTKGIVCILTNPCLDGWVKIGMTERNDIQKRLDELNQPPNIPLMFRTYALYHVESPREVETDIHELIDMIDDSLHARETLASGRIREREFFQISPEKAYRIFRKVAKFRKELDQLEMVALTAEDQEAEEVVSSRRPPFRFSMVNAPIGSELTFIRDDAITCHVVDDRNHIEYEGETTTMSALAARMFGGTSSTGYCGPKYFAYEGEVLSDRRNRYEAASGQNDE